MFALLVFGVVLALISIVIIAIAILGGIITLVGTAIGAISTALFVAFCVYLVWRIAQAILDDWNKKH